MTNFAWFVITYFLQNMDNSAINRSSYAINDVFDAITENEYEILAVSYEIISNS